MRFGLGLGCLQVVSLEPRAPVDEDDNELERLSFLQVVLAERLARLGVGVTVRLRLRLRLRLRRRLRARVR